MTKPKLTKIEGGKDVRPFPRYVSYTLDTDNGEAPARVFALDVLDRKTAERVIRKDIEDGIRAGDIDVEVGAVEADVKVMHEGGEEVVSCTLDVEVDIDVSGFWHEDSGNHGTDDEEEDESEDA